ncbi:DnaB-like helicase N-terminal domain-containing protein [Streptomyces shenzhenensis]|uniref:DnaB-like helicase N-terminal domain-containing protein n=1 Tax=Streptomyces shenzhenensis TaxID=943815 RepID=UPI0033D9BDEC
MMPPAPSAFEEDLPDSAPPPPVHYAEQALLGGLVLEPHRLHDIPDTQPAHFGSVAHAAVFDAIRTIPAPTPHQHSEDVAWQTRILDHARGQARGLTASYLHTLIQACPWTKNVAAYARIVETGHAHRTVRARAQRLAQTATDSTFPDPVSATLAQADALSDLLDELADRFPRHRTSLSHTPPPATVPRGDADEALAEERLLIATATAQPQEAEDMRWLTAHDFTHPLHAGLWQCLNTLIRRSAAIDPVTLLWEAQQHGLLTTDTDPTDVLRLLTEVAAFPQKWGESILQRSLLTTARHTARHIQAYADDPAITPHQLITGSRRALADLTAVRTRWNHATSPPPAPRPPQTRAAPPPRAGPPRTQTVPPKPRTSR